MLYNRVRLTATKIFSKIKEFINSCQSEVNAFGHQNHQHLQNLLEATEANIMGVPAYMFSGDADDYDKSSHGFYFFSYITRF